MAGTKRKPSGKVARAPSDFKRRKAKVGDRAAKPLNETNTTFKKVSIYVAGKTRSTPSAGSITSQKGKSLLELSMQASHPAAQARRSAFKGLLNIMTEFGPNYLRAHLHVFLQIASTGLVDEDPDVRKVGFTLLEAILSKYDESTLSPFLPLLVAYACSGLHSLDRDMRADGARTTDIVCSYFCSNITWEQAKSLIPPFVGLMADHRDKSLLVVLKALVKVLTTASSNHREIHDDDTTSLYTSANFSYRTGGRSRNAFMQLFRRPAQSAPEFSSAHDLFSSPSSFLSNYLQLITNGVLDDRNFLRGKPALCCVLADIQKKLCDVLVELIDADTESSRSKEKSPVIEAAATALQALYLSTRATITQTGGSKMGHNERVINILFDLFPLDSRFTSSGPEGESQEIEKCNALITKLLLLFDVILESTERIFTLVSYWIPSVEKAQRWSSCHLNVIYELMMVFSSQPIRFSSIRKRILWDIFDAFLLAPKLEVARSTAGRKVAVMLANACVEDVKRDNKDIDEKLVADITKSLPTYLQMWSSDFQEESLVVLDSMHLIVCANKNAQNNVDEVMRERISLLFKKTNGNMSTFEALPNLVRYSILGIVRILGKPSKAMLKILSLVSSRDDSTDFLSNGGIFGTVYSIRKSMTMADYLGFLIASIGVPRLSRVHTEMLSSNDGFLTFLSRLDFRVSRSAKAAVECGSRKSLKMLAPQLLRWMEPPRDGDSSPMTFMLRCRVAICFISILVLDLEKSCRSVDTDTELQPLWEGCIKSCGHIIGFLEGSDTIGIQFEARFLASLSILAEFHDGFKKHVYHTFSRSIDHIIEPRRDFTQVLNSS